MTPSGRERQAPAPKTINPEAVKFWEQAVELGSLTGLDELANYYETVAGNVQEPAERQQLLASAITAATALVKKEDVRGFRGWPAITGRASACSRTGNCTRIMY
ncbi:hypothetical protein M5E88_19950 [Akkermansia muciniphila]|nr:hypothetical protein M5E88_19950 [Akkermansia muciniphila]